MRLPGKEIKEECAKLLETLKQWPEAADLFEKAECWDSAAIAYIKMKNWSTIFDFCLFSSCKNDFAYSGLKLVKFFRM